MSSGSSPTTYIPEPATPTVTTSKTPQEDYDYAEDVLQKLEDERKAIQKRTWDELTARRKNLGKEEETSYRESMPTDEPDYTAGLDPYRLNTIATNVYTSGAQASMEDLAIRREREYTPVAGYDAPMFGEDAKTTAPLTQKQKADRLLSSFIGPKGTSGIVGGTAFGRALEYGYTPEKIKSMAREEGLTFAGNPVRALELPYSSDLTKARGPLADPNYPNALGLSAVKRLEKAGYSQQAIQSLAGEQGIKFGEDASSYLGGAPRVSAPAPAPALQPWTAPRSSSRSDITSYINLGGQASAGYMGNAAVQRAKKAGLSSAEIQRQAAAKGLKFGSDVSF